MPVATTTDRAMLVSLVERRSHRQRTVIAVIAVILVGIFSLRAVAQQACLLYTSPSPRDS